MNKITAKEGKVFIRLIDGMIFGNEISLGVDYSTGVAREDKEEYYEQVKDTSIVDFEPDKRYEIKATEKQYLNLVIAVPDLLDYLKQSSIKVYEHDNFRMFYVNSFLPGHREILTQYLGVESIIDRQNGNE